MRMQLDDYLDSNRPSPWAQPKPHAFLLLEERDYLTKELRPLSSVGQAHLYFKAPITTSGEAAKSSTVGSDRYRFMKHTYIKAVDFELVC